MESTFVVRGAVAETTAKEEKVIIDLEGLGREEAIKAVKTAMESAETDKIEILVPKNLCNLNVTVELFALLRPGVAIRPHGKSHFVRFTREIMSTNEPTKVVSRIFVAIIDGFTTPFRECADPRYAAEALVCGPR